MAITGTVKAVTGTVKAVTLDSITVTERTLQVGDQVQLGEQIITADGSSVVIEFSNGAVLDLGRNMETVLTAEMLTPEGAPATAEAPVSEEAAEAAEAEIEALQQAILEGKDPLELEATAAGPAAGPGGDGIHDFVIINYLGGELNPGYGFHTTGPGFSAFHNPNTVDFPPEEEPPVVVAGEEPPGDGGNGGEEPPPDGNGDGDNGGNGEEPLSIACLVTNTNVDNQIFTISVTSVSDGRTSTATVTANKEGGQNDFMVNFDQGFEFVNGETYWVVAEYVSGAAHVNIRGLCLKDINGKEVVLNTPPPGDANGMDDTDLGVNKITYTGVFYKISVSNDGQIQEPPDPVVGYNLSGDTLELDTVVNGVSFSLDFGQLPIGDGDGQRDLFGQVKYIDISGETHTGNSDNEDNTIIIGARDVLNLTSNQILFIRGDAPRKNNDPNGGDKVQLSDPESWSQSGSVTDGGVMYNTYTATIDNFTVTLNIDQDLATNLTT